MNNLTDGVFFFDSGVGGLSVLSACRERLKGVTFYYYGDNQNAPYGNLPPERIFQRVQEIFASCARLPIRAAVLACNTVTAVCVETLRKSLPFPIIGAEPAILLGARQGKRVLVLATKATCESLRFTLLLARARELYPQAHIEAVACEQLAGVIERGLGRGEIEPSGLIIRLFESSITDVPLRDVISFSSLTAPLAVSSVRAVPGSISLLKSVTVDDVSSIKTDVTSPFFLLIAKQTASVVTVIKSLCSDRL